MKDDIKYEIDKIDGEETLVQYNHSPEYGYGTYTTEPIISKDAFIKCWRRWIKDDQKTNYSDDSTAGVDNFKEQARR